jgi:hypothetical protein
MVQSLYSIASRLCPLAFLEDGAKFLKVKAGARDDLKMPSCKMPPKYIEALIGKSFYYTIALLENIQWFSLQISFLLQAISTSSI